MTDPAFTGHHPEPQKPNPRIYSGNNSSVQVLAENPRRRQAIIQNTGTNAVFIQMGATAAASDGNFFYILAPCSEANDGYGGGYVLSLWTGKVAAFSSGAFSVVVSEL